MTPMRIAVLAGGYSRERAVSLRSGQNVIKALSKLGHSPFLIDPARNLEDLINPKPDFAYIALHGRGGEDGSIQSFLDAQKIPYSGSKPAACALSSDKLLTKLRCMTHNIPVAPFHLIQDDASLKSCPFDFPFIVKPINEGSSIGMALIRSEDNLESVTALLTQFDCLLAEPFIEGREISVGILDSKGTPFPLPILELKTSREFYDYDAKYTPGLTTLLCPADFPKTATERYQAIAVSVHKQIGCRGLSRVDMMIDRNGDPYVLELNTSPGMTDTSDLPAQARAQGLSFEDLILLIVEESRL